MDVSSQLYAGRCRSDYRHSRRLLTGTLVVAFLIATTRWGSYLGAPPIFVTDVLFGAALIHFFLGEVRERSLPNVVQIGIGPKSCVKLLWIFLAYVVARATISNDFGSLIWARDFAPFAYALIAFLAARSFSISSDAIKTSSSNVLFFALSMHAVWSGIATYSLIPADALPTLAGSPLPLLGLRPDIDSALVGCYSAWLLFKWLRRESGSSILLLAAALSWAVVLGMSTRAGLISALICTTIALSAVRIARRDDAVYRSATRRKDRRMTALALLSGGFLASVLVLPTTAPGERLIATLSESVGVNSAQLNAQGTTNARIFGWGRVISYTQGTDARIFFGAGFGPNVLQDAEAAFIYEGTTYDGVRSPHNWLLTIFARTGLIGLFFFVALVTAVVLRVWRLRQLVIADPIAFPALLIAAALVPVSLLGVVMEAPFGAIPFWWCLGILSSIGPRMNQSFEEQSRERQPATRSPVAHPAYRP